MQLPAGYRPDTGPTSALYRPAIGPISACDRPYIGRSYYAFFPPESSKVGFDTESPNTLPIRRDYDESFKSRDLQGAFACWKLAKLFPNEGDQTVT